MPSYDLTDDDRGLDLSGRLINIDLVIARNRAYARLHNIAIPSSATNKELNIYHDYCDDILDLIQLCNRLLE